MASQYAQDIDHWVEILNNDNNGGYANSWLVGDVKTGEIVRYEQGLRYQNLARKTDGYFWTDNAPVDPRIRNLECRADDLLTFVRPMARGGSAGNNFFPSTPGHIDADVARRMLGDTFDPYLGDVHPSGRTICGHPDDDPCQFGGPEPFRPFGSVDGKVVTIADVESMSLWARFGRADGAEFIAEDFLRAHSQWDWQRGLSEVPGRAALDLSPARCGNQSVNCRRRTLPIRTTGLFTSANGRQ